MTPLQLAKTYCSSHREDACTGLTILDNGSNARFRPAGNCLLSSPIQRCQHFESCVAPIEQSLKRQFSSPSDWPQNKFDRAAFPNLVDSFSSAVHDYKIPTGAMLQSKRRCPDCKERFCEPNKHRCISCSTAALKISIRQRNQSRIEKTRSQVHTKTLEMTPKPQ